ncbi:MAG TPA: lipoyl domain-containing protein, partial [Thermomicrobiales bacterium]|nr:lipoyl domain-containing protein [Thermomicrobiales bacterium]
MPAVIMPKMGDAMEEGTLLRWLKHEGDAVAVGEAIAEIETDKATLELNADDAGVLGQITTQEGETVPIGQRIAMILGEGESPDGANGAAEAAAPARAAARAAEPAAPPATPP